MSACAGHPAAGFRLGPGANVDDDRAIEVTVEEPFTNPIEDFVRDRGGVPGQALNRGLDAAQRFGIEPKREHVAEDATTTARISGSIMMVAQAIIVAVVALIVLGSLYSTDIVANPTYNNTWTTMFDTFASYGETAFILIGVGLIAAGASVALGFFGGMGGGMNGGR
ncbi:hypothetical protein [Haloferax volcanii]|uniref:hypothetical protein n=1 Tax=Haloferax volcanii TaxID=2246 RepID=UPI00249AA6BC|nr:hypothetical protein [Haloferax alexandrinus]